MKADAQLPQHCDPEEVLQSCEPLARDRWSSKAESRRSTIARRRHAQTKLIHACAGLFLNRSPGLDWERELREAQLKPRGKFARALGLDPAMAEAAAYLLYLPVV